MSGWLFFFLGFLAATMMLGGVYLNARIRHGREMDDAAQDIRELYVQNTRLINQLEDRIRQCES